MAANTNPNQILSNEIVSALKANGLILEQNADNVVNYLAEGKMKDSIWLKAFENKLASLKASNEA